MLYQSSAKETCAGGAMTRSSFAMVAREITPLTALAHTRKNKRKPNILIRVVHPSPHANLCGKFFWTQTSKWGLRKSPPLAQQNAAEQMYSKRCQTSLSEELSNCPWQSR